MALAVLFLLSLSACGGGKGEEQATTTTSTIENAADHATAGQLVLQATDLPTGWQPVPTSASSNNLASGIYDQLGTCLGVDPASINRTVLFSGDTFAQGNNALSSGASGFKSADTVTTELAGIKDAKNYNCILQVFNAVAGQLSGGAAAATPNAKVGTIEGVTTEANQFTLRITTEFASQAINNQTIYTDLVGTGNGRFMTIAALNYFGTPPPADLEQQILGALKTRAASATQS